MAETPSDSEQNQDEAQENSPLISQVDEAQETSEKTGTVQDTELRDDSTAKDKNQIDLEFILDIPLTVTVEVGRTKLLIQDLLQLGQGSVIELDKLMGESFEVLVNEKLVARGEIVVVNDRFGVRLNDIISPTERVQTLA